MWFIVWGLLAVSGAVAVSSTPARAEACRPGDKADASRYRSNERRVAHVRVSVPSASVDGPTEGTGFLIGTGWVLTARHVVEPIFRQITVGEQDQLALRSDYSISLSFHDGQENREPPEYRAVFEHSWPEHDLALLRVPAVDNDLRLRGAVTLRADSWTRQECYEVLGITMVNGVIRYRRLVASRVGPYDGWKIELRSNAFPGFSGGPVLIPADGWGAIGVIISRIDEPGERKLMMPLKRIVGDLRELISPGALAPKATNPPKSFSANIKRVGINLEDASFNVKDPLIEDMMDDPVKRRPLVDAVLKTELPQRESFRERETKDAVVRYRDLVDRMIEEMFKKLLVDGVTFSGLVSRALEAWDLTGTRNRQTEPWGAEPRAENLRLRIADLEYRTRECDRTSSTVVVMLCLTVLGRKADTLQAVAEKYATDAWEWMLSADPADKYSALTAALTMTRAQGIAMRTASATYRIAGTAGSRGAEDVPFRKLTKASVPLPSKTVWLLAATDRLLFALTRIDQALGQASEHEAQAVMTKTTIAGKLPAKDLTSAKQTVQKLAITLCGNLRVLGGEIATEFAGVLGEADKYAAQVQWAIDGALDSLCGDADKKEQKTTRTGGPARVVLAH